MDDNVQAAGNAQGAISACGTAIAIFIVGAAYHRSKHRSRARELLCFCIALLAAFAQSILLIVDAQLNSTYTPTSETLYGISLAFALVFTTLDTLWSPRSQGSKTHKRSSIFLFTLLAFLVLAGAGRLGVCYALYAIDGAYAPYRPTYTDSIRGPAYFLSGSSFTLLNQLKFLFTVVFWSIFVICAIVWLLWGIIILWGVGKEWDKASTRLYLASLAAICLASIMTLAQDAADPYFPNSSFNFSWAAVVFYQLGDVCLSVALVRGFSSADASFNFFPRFRAWRHRISDRDIEEGSSGLAEHPKPGDMAEMGDGPFPRHAEVSAESTKVKPEAPAPSVRIEMHGDSLAELCSHGLLQIAAELRGDDAQTYVRANTPVELPADDLEFEASDLHEIKSSVDNNSLRPVSPEK